MQPIVVKGSRGEAVFSADFLYRYYLSRPFDTHATQASLCQFIMLNPSTADADVDDPTLTRCVDYARLWGHTGVIITNLFALRATDPRQLDCADDPVGYDNTEFVLRAATQPDATRVVCARGVRGAYTNAGDSMRKQLRERGVTLCALRITRDGHPAHPLYLPSHLEPVPLFD